jgi:hypothetical protein
VFLVPALSSLSVGVPPLVAREVAQAPSCPPSAIVFSLASPSSPLSSSISSSPSSSSSSSSHSSLSSSFFPSFLPLSSEVVPHLPRFFTSSFLLSLPTLRSPPSLPHPLISTPLKHRMSLIRVGKGLAPPPFLPLEA